MEPIQAPTHFRLLIGFAAFLAFQGGSAARADILVASLGERSPVATSNLVAAAPDSGAYRARDTGPGYDAELVGLSTLQVCQLLVSTVAIPWATDEGGGSASESATSNSVTNAPQNGQNHSSSSNSGNGSDDSGGTGTISGGTDQPRISETPEPGGLALSILGGGTWVASLFRRRRR
jgi:hypothetical protein